MPELQDVRPRFFMQPVEDEAATAKEGRPIFTDQEYVEILIPGDRLSKPVFPVSDEHRKRWPQAYEAFRRGHDHVTHGTPLEQWPPLTSARVMELKSINILTVEDLAGLADRAIAQLGPDGRQLREKARAFLDAAAGGATVAAQAQEIAALREQVERLMTSMAQPAPTPEPEANDEPEPRALDDLSDDELKAYIKRETGEGIRGTPSRETLLQRAASIAQGETEAA